jgi:ubiquinone/menaquinone biosynthesis C-methylase UbiE
MSPLETSQKFFNENASQWDNDPDAQRAGRLFAIFNELVPELNGPFLDVGCGTGIMIPIINKTAEKYSAIVELDISENMIRCSKEKFGTKEQINFSIGDVHNAPFRNTSFGSVICFAVLPHFYDQDRALTELKRVLMPGGKIIILHLMGHAELNQMHRNAGHAVARHTLKSTEVVSFQLQRFGFTVLTAMEKPDLYLIVAQKPAKL